MPQPAQQLHQEPKHPTCKHWYDAKEAALKLGISTKKMHQLLERSEVVWKDKTGDRHPAPGWQRKGLIRADQRKHTLEVGYQSIPHWYNVIQISERGLGIIKQLLEVSND